MLPEARINKPQYVALFKRDLFWRTFRLVLHIELFLPPPRLSVAL